MCVIYCIAGDTDCTRPCRRSCCFHSRAPPGVPLGRDKTVLVNYASFVRAHPQLLMYELGGYCWPPNTRLEWSIHSTDIATACFPSTLNWIFQIIIIRQVQTCLLIPVEYTIEHHANWNWISSTVLQLLGNWNTIIEVPEVPPTSRHGCLFRKNVLIFLLLYPCVQY